jgi:hypothetical protein
VWPGALTHPFSGDAPQRRSNDGVCDRKRGASTMITVADAPLLRSRTPSTMCASRQTVRRPRPGASAARPKPLCPHLTLLPRPGRLARGRGGGQGREALASATPKAPLPPPRPREQSAAREQGETSRPVPYDLLLVALPRLPELTPDVLQHPSVVPAWRGVLGLEHAIGDPHQDRAAGNAQLTSQLARAQESLAHAADGRSAK